MEDLKHECGVAMIRLLKPLEYYRQKYGTARYGLDKLYLLMEKQHNRGQDHLAFSQAFRTSGKGRNSTHSPVVSGKPHMRLRFWTACPEAPLVRLSMALETMRRLVRPS